MARRSDHTPDALAALAVEKALEIIDEKGPEGFGARAVAGAMGYSPGTLYHTFGTMEDFRLRVTGAILDALHARLARGLQSTRKAPLHYLADAYIDFARRENGRWRMLFAARAPQEAPLPAWYAEKTAALFALVAGALPEGDAQARAEKAQLLWAGMHGICVLALSGKLDAAGAAKPAALAAALVDSVAGR